MSTHSLCKPRQSVFAADRRATVLSLDTFLKGQVNGSEFFEENFFTSGMLTRMPQDSSLSPRFQRHPALFTDFGNINLLIASNAPAAISPLSRPTS